MCVCVLFSEREKEHEQQHQRNPEPKRPIVAADGRRLKRRWISSGAGGHWTRSDGGWWAAAHGQAVN
jgi:hypothetical protein